MFGSTRVVVCKARLRVDGKWPFASLVTSGENQHEEPYGDVADDVDEKTHNGIIEVIMSTMNSGWF